MAVNQSKDVDLKKWALEYALRVPNNQLKHPIPQYFGNVPQNISAQVNTEGIIKEADKILKYLNGTNKS